MVFNSVQFIHLNSRLIIYFLSEKYNNFSCNLQEPTYIIFIFSVCSFWPDLFFFPLNYLWLIYLNPEIYYLKILTPVLFILMTQSCNFKKFSLFKAYLFLLVFFFFLIYNILGYILNDIFLYNIFYYKLVILFQRLGLSHEMTALDSIFGCPSYFHSC